MANLLPIVLTATAAGGGAAVSTVHIPDQFRNPFNIGLGSAVTTGTATYTIEHTFDDVLSPDWVAASGNWATNSGWTGSKTAADGLVSGNYAYPVGGIRINISAGTGTVTLWIRQAGTR